MIGHQATGNETFVVNLINALARLEGHDQEYTVYVDSNEARESLRPYDGRLKIRRLATHAPLIRAPFLLPAEIWRSGMDVAHMQYVLPPVLPGCATVLTVHDISFEHFPGVFKRTELVRDKLLVPYSARRADVVLTISEFSKADMVRTYGIDPAKIVVTAVPAPPRFRRLEGRSQVDDVRRRYGIDEPFILYVGNIQPRKNLVRLVQAYATLAAGGQIPHRLVIVGKMAWQHSQVLEAARACGLERRITFTGFVPEEDLCALYNAADLFVFPSIFEGFGTPILEAMSCGIPVITSNTSSMPEVGGDAALYVDPFKVADLVLAMRTVLEDSDLRARLSARGLARARQFSWEDTARKAAEAYEMAVRARFRSKRTAVGRNGADRREEIAS
jgi:glycosyltransferase involved in cell wall biosynthesis